MALKSPRRSQKALFPSDGTQHEPFVRVYRFGRFFRSFKLKEGTYLIGRDPQADISLNLRYVSRQHCQLEFKGENQLFLQDLGSSNGTFVNGERVSRCLLVHGDQIRIGEVHIKVSHPSCAQGQVIPFPNVRTEPEIQLPLEPPSPVVTPPQEPSPQKVERISIKPSRQTPSSIEIIPRAKPFRVGPSRLQQTFGLLSLVAIAGGLGWGLHQWRSEDVADSSVSDVSLSAEAPGDIFAKDSEVVPPQPKTSRIRTSKPAPKKTTRAKTTLKRSKVSEKPKEMPKKVPTADLVASLDRSLDHLESNGLGDMNELQPSQRLSTGDFTRRLKTLKASSEHVDAEIEMPKSEEMKVAAVKKQSLKPVDLKEFQANLRNQIDGVDECFVKHVTSGTPGKVSVWFSIGPSGGVSKAGLVSSTYGSAPFHKCILGQIQRMKVSRPPWDDFTMTYSFRFGKRSITF